MFCPFCGHQNRDGKKFCRQCGRTLPAPRTNVGTTPLSYYNEFAEEFINNPLEQNPPLGDSPRSKPVNQLIDQSLYNNFSSSDSLSSSPTPIKPQWQPNTTTESNENSFQESPSQELEEQLNQFTQQLLPDTVDFQVPKSMPPFPQNTGRNGNPSLPNFDDPPKTKSVGSFSSSGLDLRKGPSPVKLSSSISQSKPIVDFNDFPNEDNSTTDEMEALSERNWEKTADIPVLTEKTADMPALIEKTADIPVLGEKTGDFPVKAITASSSSQMVITKAPEPILPKETKISSNVNNYSPPLTGTLSITTSPTIITPPIEKSQIVEKLILIILALVALVGVSILVWILILKPLGIAYFPTIPGQMAKNSLFEILDFT